LLVSVNNRLKFEIEIVHDLSCHPIIATHGIAKAFLSVCPSVRLSNACVVTIQKKFVPTFLHRMRKTFILVFRHEEWLVGTTTCT